MKTILQLLNLHETKGMYGIEIEVEGKKLPSPANIDPSLWIVEKDGSLKAPEAWEYVTPKPLPLSKVENSLNYLDNLFNAHNSKMDESIRAGVHVHMNVQSWNIKQIITFSMLYYLFENILMNFCGPNREGNLFSLRTSDAEYPIFRLLHTLKTKNLKHLNNDIIRYASLNFCSLFKYGSLEFRGMRSTRDFNKILDWVNIIEELRVSSLKFDNPTDVLELMSGSNELQFLEEVFPNSHIHLNKSKEMIETIRSNARRVQIIAYMIDWKDIEAENVNPFIQGW